MGDAVSIIAIGFAGYFVAVAAHITFNSLYACLFVSNLVVRARVGIGAMFLLSAIANFVQYMVLGRFGCLLAAKLAIISFHLQMLAGEAFQLYRISVITGGNHLFVGVAVFLLSTRVLASVPDIVLSTSVPSSIGACAFKQDLYSGILYVTMDAIVELFITTTITIALVHHTSVLKRMHRDYINTSMYKFIIEINIFRTVILSLISLFTLLIIILYPYSVALWYMWSLMGIAYLYFIIYDKAMVRFLHQLANTSDQARRFSTGRNSLTPLSQSATHPNPNFPDEDNFTSAEGYVDQYFAQLTSLSSRNASREPPMNTTVMY